MPRLPVCFSSLPLSYSPALHIPLLSPLTLSPRWTSRPFIPPCLLIFHLPLPCEQPCGVAYRAICGGQDRRGRGSSSPLVRLSRRHLRRCGRACTLLAEGVTASVWYQVWSYLINSKARHFDSLYVWVGQIEEARPALHHTRSAHSPQCLLTCSPAHHHAHLPVHRVHDKAPGCLRVTLVCLCLHSLLLAPSHSLNHISF